MPIKISSHFDAGAIEVVSTDQLDLNLRKDSHADAMQWFYFRVQGARNQACAFRILNAIFLKGIQDRRRRGQLAHARTVD